MVVRKRVDDITKFQDHLRTALSFEESWGESVRVIKNDKYINTRRRVGRIFFFGGFGLLILGLVISLSPTGVSLFGFSLASLLLGTIAAQIGGQYTRRFDRGPLPLPHDVLGQNLKGFDTRFVLAHYMTPAAHVLLTPDQVYVLIAKPQAGRISYENSRWHNPIGLRRLFTWMSEEGLGNPTREAKTEIERFDRFVVKELPESSIDAKALIVFIDPKADLDTSGSPTPAVHIKKLKNWIRRQPKGKLTQTAYTALSSLLTAEEVS